MSLRKVEIMITTDAMFFLIYLLSVGIENLDYIQRVDNKFSITLLAAVQQYVATSLLTSSPDMMHR